MSRADVQRHLARTSPHTFDELLRNGSDSSSSMMSVEVDRRAARERYNRELENIIGKQAYSREIDRSVSSKSAIVKRELKEAGVLLEHFAKSNAEGDRRNVAAQKKRDNCCGRQTLFDCESFDFGEAQS